MKLIIDEISEDSRIDSYLAEIMPNLSRSQIQKGIKQGVVSVNSNSVKSSYTLKVGDIIEFEKISKAF